MERDGERGGRGGARGSIAIVMEYDDDIAIAYMIMGHHRHLFTKLESNVAAVFLGRRKGRAYGTSQPEEHVRRIRGIGDDPQLEAMLERGEADFCRAVVGRILSEHLGEVEFNRCPRCNRIPRTPQAKQCRWCKHDWHQPAR